MRHELRIFDDANALAHAGALFIEQFARDERRVGERVTIALSGGKSPWLMLADLAGLEVDWAETVFFQVDERVAPEGSDERNLTHLQASLAGVPAVIEAMDVNAENLEGAAERYAADLPDRLDLVHLGIGPDGHCASLVPGDHVLEVLDRPVAVTGLYQGTHRMTLTYPTIDRARQLLWLISGKDKVDALARLLDGDPSIPAGRVEAQRSLVLCDKEARGR